MVTTRGRRSLANDSVEESPTTRSRKTRASLPQEGTFIASLVDREDI